MGSKPDGLNDLWKTLKPIFDKMLNMQGLTKAEHASIYNGVYGYCTATDNSFITPPPHGSDNKVIGYELYKKLRSYFKQHVVTLRGVWFNLKIDFKNICRRVKIRLDQTY